MQVEDVITARLVRHGERAGRPRMRALADVLATLPPRIELGTFSRANGAWRVDWAKARADAQRTLASIDLARRDVVLWVPGTDGSGVQHDFRQAVEDLYGPGADLSLAALHYGATWELRESLPTGLATLKLVLEGIRQRLERIPAGQRPRILLAGESQGAWIIGEAMADRRVGSVVSRAILAGHPWMAATRYEDGHDPRVRVINHRGDQITMPVRGDVGAGLDAMAAVRMGRLGAELGTVARAILANPVHGLLLLHTELRRLDWLRPFLRDPHSYATDMPRMVRFLRTGELLPTNEDVDDVRNGRRPLSDVAPS